MIPVLETKRLILRPPTLDDAPALQQGVDDWEVAQYFTKAFPWPYPENGAVDFLSNLVFPFQGENLWYWAICLKEAPEIMIGSICLRANDPEGHRAFWLARAYQGHGLMSEAVTEINNFAFDSLGWEELIIKNAIGNYASHRIKEKNGATLLEIVDEDSDHYLGDFTQSAVWRIRREEWQKRQRTSR